MMESRSEHCRANNGAKVEISTITHEGRDFSALGSVVDHERGIVIGYPKGSELRTWDGTVIGSLRVTGSARGFHGVKLVCYRATIDGIPYYGRGQGDGMILRLRRVKGTR